MNRCRCCARLLENTTESNSEFANACRRPCSKNNAWTPYMVENRSTGGLAPPAVPPAPTSDREQSFRFALAGCSVGVLNLKLPTLGIPPREPGGGCQTPTANIVCSIIIIKATTGLFSKITSFDLSLEKVCWLISITKFII